MPPDPDVTELLGRLRRGSVEARDELVAGLYLRFRQRAHQHLQRERPGHSFATSDLTDEALLRLLRSDEIARAADGNQLFRAFARAVRQALVDHARRRDATKRGGDRRREELDDLADDVGRRLRSDLLTLDESLGALAAEHPRVGEALEMRFFGGFETAEVAAALGVSPSTVERDVRFGLAWLRDFHSPEGAT